MGSGGEAGAAVVTLLIYGAIGLTVLLLFVVALVAVLVSGRNKDCSRCGTPLQPGQRGLCWTCRARDA